jgi:hypothetical protein
MNLGIMSSGPCNRGEWEPESEWLARRDRTCPGGYDRYLDAPPPPPLADYTAQDVGTAVGNDLALVGLLAIGGIYLAWRWLR